jgi:hypothetical protein
MDVMAFNNEPNVPLREENRDCTKEVHGWNKYFLKDLYFILKFHEFS